MDGEQAEAQAGDGDDNDEVVAAEAANRMNRTVQGSGNQAAVTTTILSSTVTDIVGRTVIVAISGTAARLSDLRIRGTKIPPLAEIPWVVALRIMIGLKSDRMNQGR